MPIRSASISEDAPLERIKRIKDIAVSRKEEVEKHGNDIIQQALERSAFRTKKTNVNCINQKPTIAEIRESKKESFAEEFSKMGCLNCNEEGSNKVDSRIGIGKGRFDSNLEEGSKGHQSKHPAEHSTKPRWNSGTITSNITESHDLYGYREPFIKNFKQKHVASTSSKDGSVNESQSKTKPSVKETSVHSRHRQIPIIKSLIMEDKRNRTDISPDSRIPKHTSEPYMTKRYAPSTKMHREKCQATDSDTPNSKHNDYNTFSATKYRKVEAVSTGAADKQCNNAFAKDRKPSDIREKKVQQERPSEKDKTVEVKEEAESKTIKPKPFKSKIPALSKAHNDVDSSLGLGHSRYFRDNQCQCQCHCTSNVASVTMPEPVEPVSGNRHPARNVTDAKKVKVKSPSKKRPDNQDQ